MDVPHGLLHSACAKRRKACLRLLLAMILAMLMARRAMTVTDDCAGLGSLFLRCPRRGLLIKFDFSMMLDDVVEN